MSSKGSFVFCFSLIVLTGSFWIMVEPRIRAESKPAADIDTGSTHHQMCQDFVARNPRAEVVHVKEYAEGITVYRYVILEGQGRERLLVVLTLGYRLSVSQRDELCFVEGDMVDLALTTPSPYVQIKRSKP